MSIIELIFSPIFWAISSLFSLFPRITLPESGLDTLAGFFNFVAQIGYFIPLSTIAVIFQLIIAVYVVRFSIAIVVFTLKKLPLLGIK